MKNTAWFLFWGRLFASLVIGAAQDSSTSTVTSTVAPTTNVIVDGGGGPVTNNPDSSGFYINLDSEMGNTTLLEGGRLILDCEITGYPKPIYEFYKDGQKIDFADSKYDFRDLFYGFRLRIDHVALADAGTYRCLGYSGSGNLSTTSHVVINPAPRTRRTDPPPNRTPTPNIGGDAKLTDPLCSAYKGHYCNFLKSKEIYVRTRTDQNTADSRVLTLFRSLTGIGLDNSNECFQRSIEAMCYYSMPLCVRAEPEVLPQRLCRSDCESLYGICQDDFQSDVSNWSLLPNCEDLDNERGCVHIPGFMKPENLDTVDGTVEDDNSEVLVQYILPTILGMVVIGAIIATIVCVKRNQAKSRLRGTSSTNSSAAKSQEMSVISDRSSHISHTLKEVAVENINMLQELGSGVYGQVWKGQAFGLYGSNTASAVFIKTLKPQPKSIETEEYISFRVELSNVAELKHQHILQLLAISTKSVPQCLLFEHLATGDLQQYLQNQEAHGVTLNHRETMYVVTQIASGLEYLSLQNFVHEDVACHNIIMGQNLNIKISVLKVCYGVHSSSYYTLHSTLMPVRWLPPETITYGKFCKETDVYMFGILLWEAFSHGRQPYEGFSNQEVIEMVRSRQLLSTPADCPPRLYSLMMECWHEDPFKRPTAKDVHQKMRAWYLDNTYAFSTTTGPSGTSVSSSTVPSHHSGSTGHAPLTKHNLSNLIKAPDTPYYSTIDNGHNRADSPTSCSMTSFEGMSDMTESTNHPGPLPTTNGMNNPPSYFSSTPQARYASLSRKKPDAEFGSQTQPLFQTMTDQV